MAGAQTPPSVSDLLKAAVSAVPGGITPDKTVTLANAQDEYAVDRTPNDFSKDTQLAAALALLEG